MLECAYPRVREYKKSRSVLGGRTPAREATGLLKPSSWRARRTSPAVLCLVDRPFSCWLIIRSSCGDARHHLFAWAGRAGTSDMPDSPAALLLRAAIGCARRRSGRSSAGSTPCPEAAYHGASQRRRLAQTCVHNIACGSTAASWWPRTAQWQSLCVRGQLVWVLSS